MDGKQLSMEATMHISSHLVMTVVVPPTMLLFLMSL
jgi:hypothetical protein